MLRWSEDIPYAVFRLSMRHRPVRAKRRTKSSVGKNSTFDTRNEHSAIEFTTGLSSWKRSGFQTRKLERALPRGILVRHVDAEGLLLVPLQRRLVDFWTSAPT